MPEMFVNFIICLAFLVISSSLLLKFSEKLSSRIRISPLIIGITLVAIGTSLPETFVAISAIFQGAPLVSFGDIIGSSIVNICLILGLNILIFPVRIGTEKTQKNNIILLLVTLFFVILFFLPEPLRKTLGIFLLVFYVFFVITEIIWGRNGSNKEDKKTLSKLEKSKGSPILYLVGIIVSLVGLIVSSRYLVTDVITISKVLNINQEIIGLSLVALGTSLPELAATIASGMKQDWKLLYGSIQGSNIYDLSVVGAILIVLNNTPYSIDVFTLIYMAIIVISIVVLSHKYMGTNIPRYYGLLYLAAYAFYIFKLYYM